MIKSQFSYLFNEYNSKFNIGDGLNIKLVSPLIRESPVFFELLSLKSAIYAPLCPWAPRRGIYQMTYIGIYSKVETHGWKWIKQHKLHQNRIDDNTGWPLEHENGHQERSYHYKDEAYWTIENQLKMIVDS